MRARGKSKISATGRGKGQGASVRRVGRLAENRRFQRMSPFPLVDCRCVVPCMAQEQGVAAAMAFIAILARSCGMMKSGVAQRLLRPCPILPMGGRVFWEGKAGLRWSQERCAVVRTEEERSWGRMNLCSSTVAERAPNSSTQQAASLRASVSSRMVGSSAARSASRAARAA